MKSAGVSGDLMYGFDEANMVDLFLFGIAIGGVGFVITLPVTVIAGILIAVYLYKPGRYEPITES